MPRTPHSWIHTGIDEVQVNGNSIEGTYKVLNIIATGAVGSANPTQKRYDVNLTGIEAATVTGGSPGSSTGSGAARVQLATTANHGLTGLGTLDGVLLLEGDLVLVWKQSTASENGIYVASAGAWSRADAFNEDGEIYPGQLVMVITGATYADTLFSVVSDADVVVGSTPITYRPLQPYIDSNLDLNGNDIILNGGSIISGTTGDASAVIDFSQTTTGGILIPTLTTAERDAIGSPANGLLIFNSDTNQFEYWDGSTWVAINTSSAASSGYAVVRAASTGNAPLTGAAVSDGVTLADGDQFLCWAQSDPTENGIYTVDTGGAWSRTAPYDAGTGIYGGLIVYVNEGLTYGDTLFSVVNNSAITVGATAIQIAPLLEHLDEIALVQAAAPSDHGLSGLAAVDGVVVSNGSLVLLANQSDASENGVYSAASGSWSRAPGFQFGYQMPPGKLFFVNSGATFANKMFAVNTDVPANLDSDALIIRPLQPEIDADLDFNSFLITNLGSIVVGGSAADASSVADFNSTSKGLLPPRMTTVQRNAISSPATGLVVYNTSTGGIEWYDGSAWQSALSGVGTFLGLSDVSSSTYSGAYAHVPRVNAAQTALELSPSFGTPMTTSQRNAISLPIAGTFVWNTDTDQLEVYNGSTWGAVDSGAGASTFLGLTDTPGAYLGGTTNHLVGVDNSSLGLEFKANTRIAPNSSIYIDESLSSVAIGTSQPLNHASGSATQSVGVGHNAGGAADGYSFCTYLGSEAGVLNTQSSNNVGVGYRSNRGYSGFGNTENVTVGNFCMFNQGAGASHNTAVGHSAMYSGAGATPQYVTAVGANAGYSTTTAENSVYLGYYAGYSVTGGDRNTFLGAKAGEVVVSGNDNILVGYNLDTPASTTSFYLNIGNAIFGDLDTKRIRIGGTVGNIIGSVSLRLDDTDKAFVTNRLTTTQRNAVVSPEAGMFIWNTSSDQFEYHDGSSWQALGGGGSGGTFLGLSDTPGAYTARAFPASNSGGSALEWSALYSDPSKNAVRVGGSGALDNDVSLELAESDAALLLNRMTGGGQGSLSPQEGMLLYNYTSDEVKGYAASSWRPGGISTGLYLAGESTIEIQDTAGSSGANLYIQAQAANGGGGVGGRVWLRGGTGTSEHGYTDIGNTSNVPIATEDDDIGFFGATPIGRPGVTGSRGSGAALFNLLEALADLGLISNNTIA